ncbi:MAG: hypothetical protein WCV99_02590 [Sterolibacterium sp.]|jgi:hypothetical protein
MIALLLMGITALDWMITSNETRNGSVLPLRPTASVLLKRGGDSALGFHVQAAIAL